MYQMEQRINKKKLYEVKDRTHAASKSNSENIFKDIFVSYMISFFSSGFYLFRTIFFDVNL